MQAINKWICFFFFIFLQTIITECVFAWSFTPPDINALHNNPPVEKFSYGDDPVQAAELRLPAHKGLYPVAIIVHGGCWLSKYAEMQNTAALADALRDEGIATWNIEYRSVDQEGGGWPGTLQDVAQAADYLKTIAEKYHLDLSHVIVVGHSAGGQLALWLAARHRLPPDSELYVKNPLKIKGVVALGGVTDLKTFRTYVGDACGPDIVQQLLGAQSPESFERRYSEASPMALLPLGVPQILIYGKDDQSVPASFGQAYVQAAQKKGDTAKIVVVEDAGHHEVIVPKSITWPAVKAAVMKLIK